MLRITANKRALSTLGTCVLAVFLFGLSSGPLRPCASHPGHTSAPHGSHVAPDQASSHHATHSTEQTHAPDEGCTCLDQCSLEHAPYLFGADLPSLAYDTAIPRALVASAGRAHAKHDQFGVPLARPPPEVV